MFASTRRMIQRASASGKQTDGQTEETGAFEGGHEQCARPRDMTRRAACCSFVKCFELSQFFLPVIMKTGVGCMLGSV